MTIEEIIEVLRFANGQGLPVRLVLRDGSEVHGIPTVVDLHVTAHEVFLQPMGGDETEVGVSLAAIRSAELD